MKINQKFITPPLVFAFCVIATLSSCKPEVPQPNTYTVKFDANGGTGNAPVDILATYDEEFALPENTFTKVGYNFAGWNTKPDGSGDNYEVNAKVKNLTAENGATVTLYAKWSEKDKVAKVTFSHVGGTTVDSGETVTLSCATDGATIYYVLVSGTQTLDLSKKQKYETPITISDDITIAAVAVKEGMNQSDVATAIFTVKTYTVTFSTVYGTAPVKITGLKKGSKLSEQQLPALTATGYTFGSWYNGEGQFTIDTEITADITLTAKWTVKEYSITYELDGGTNAEDNPASYTIETETITLNEAKKDGYNFVGWYESEDFSGNAVTGWKAGEKIENVVLFAKWELIITAENICDVIGGLSEGRHTISVTGELPENKFAEIKEAINANQNAKISLDLSSVTGLSKIPDEAFADCSNLVGIVIPDGSDGGVTLGAMAFNSCTGLENIYLPKDVYIGYVDNVFDGCTSLLQVSFGGTMEEFADSSKHHFYAYPDIFKAAITFSDGTSWTMGKDIKDSAEENPEFSYSGEWNNVVKYMLKNTLKSGLSKKANLDLSGMTGLTEISSSTELQYLNIAKLILPSCATKICSETFDNAARYIENIVIPGNIKTIESSAFRNNTSLSQVEIGYGVESIGSNAFQGCRKLKSVNIPASVKSLSDRLIFNNCESLETAVIEASGAIGESCFSECNMLKKVTLGQNVTSIGDCAFENCSSLSEIVIPEGVTSIGFSAFSSCTLLSEITIPSTVKSIDSGVFAGTAATSINYNGRKVQWEAIEKIYEPLNGSKIKTIKCSDGDIPL